PRPVFVVLVEALGIVGEQALGLPELLGGQRLVDRGGVLVALAEALAALGAQSGDIGARLRDLREARDLLVGVAQHVLGMREVAGLGEAPRLGDQPTGLGLAQLRVAIGAGLGEFLLQGWPR